MTTCVACLRRLKKAETDFCAACRQELFDGVAVSVVLPFAPPATATYEEMKRLHELTRQISVVVAEHSPSAGGERGSL